MEFQFSEQLKDLNQESHSFSSQTLKGQKHLLLFYHTHCLGCTGRAIPLAYQLQKSYPNTKVILIHVNLGSLRPTTKEILSVFVDGKSPLPIFIDEVATLYHQFKCEGTPHWIFLDENAQVQNSIFGSQANAKNRLMYTLDQV